MKRRGFLGFLGAGAVAGPALAQEAVSNVFGNGASLGANAFNSGILTAGEVYSGGAGDYFKRELASIMSWSDERKDWERRNTGVFSFDPDIAGYRSISLQAKIKMQRDRNFVASVENRKKSLMLRIAGILD